MVWRASFTKTCLAGARLCFTAKTYRTGPNTTLRSSRLPGRCRHCISGRHPGWLILCKEKARLKTYTLTRTSTSLCNSHVGLAVNRIRQVVDNGFNPSFKTSRISLRFRSFQIPKMALRKSLAACRLQFLS